MKKITWLCLAASLCSIPFILFIANSYEFNRVNLRGTKVVMSTLQVNQNSILIGTDNGLWQTTNQGKSFAYMQNELANSIVESLSMDSKGWIWAGAKGGVWFSKDAGQHFAKCNIATLHSDADITQIYRDSFNNIWVTTWFNGLLESTDDGVTFNVVNTDTFPVISILTFVYQTNGQTIWVGTYTHGLWSSIDQGKTFQQVAKTEGDSYNCMVEDQLTKEIWVGTGELAKLNGKLLLSKDDGKNWTVDSDFSVVPIITSLAINQTSGALWVGSGAQGAWTNYKRDGKVFEQMKFNQSSEYWISSILPVDSNFILIAAGGDGLWETKN